MVDSRLCLGMSVEAQTTVKRLYPKEEKTETSQKQKKPARNVALKNSLRNNSTRSIMCGPSRPSRTSISCSKPTG